MNEPIHVYVSADDHDPRHPAHDPPGITVQRGPALHPDDLAVVDGLPVTSVSRTLIDLGEILNEDELRECFENARDRGLLDQDALRVSRERVEGRSSLPLVDRLIGEFAPR